jgi:hypothetical protein
MDRLSFAFFAAAFLITGTAVAGLALRAGMPVADASVAAGFGEVVAAGSSSTPLRRDEAGPERAEAATAPAGPTTGTRIARHAPAPRVRPMPAGAPAAAAAPTCEAALVIECVPGVAWTEEQHAALAASVARAEQATAHLRVRRVRFELERTRIREIEREHCECPHRRAAERLRELEPVPSTAS